MSETAEMTDLIVGDVDDVEVGLFLEKVEVREVLDIFDEKGRRRKLKK